MSRHSYLQLLFLMFWFPLLCVSDTDNFPAQRHLFGPVSESAASMLPVSTPIDADTVSPSDSDANDFTRAGDSRGVDSNGATG